jgi:nitrite reductase/ring-hydroxylating ferredoxin subunit
MKPESFVRVAKVDELVGRGPFAVSANGLDIALLRTKSNWRAFDGRCPHQGALLGEGELEGEALVCRNHRWRFALDSGRRIGGPGCLASCPVVERDGAVFVDVTGLSAAQPKKGPTRSIDDLPGPRPLPLVGNLLQLDAARVHLILEDWTRLYGPTYQFRMGPARLIATRDPGLIDEALRERPETFSRSSKVNEILSEVGINGVFNAEGGAWRPQRKLSVAALAQRNLRQLYPCIAIVSERLRGRWSRMAASGETLDVIDELKRFTVDVTMLIVFGHDVNTVEQSGDVIQRHLEVILPAISRRIFALAPTWR